MPKRFLLLVLALLVSVLSSPGLVTAQTWERRDLCSFGQRDPQGGRNPADPPILGADGNLYGTTNSGGAFTKGVVYRFRPSDASYLVLRHFLGGADGGMPLGTAFLQADDQRLYGLAVNPRLILYSLKTDGSDYRSVFTFPAGAEQGGIATNVSTITAGPDGLIYGIYVTGGSNSPPSQGTLFRVARDGTGFQILGNVVSPSSPLSFGAKGQLFGLTFSTLYRLETDGTNFQTLVNFPPTQFGPAQAEGGLVHASDGFMYGVTDSGGSFGFGTIFRVHEDGSGFQVIFEPSSVMDGGHYRAPALEGSDGFIYGALGENSFGVDSVIWRIHKDGTGWQVLKRLGQNGRGTNGVVEAPDGFLYACNPVGGTSGQMIRLSRDGASYSVVRDFPSAEAFPLTPIAIVRGADQRLYGLTDKDGTGGHGTLFRTSGDGAQVSQQWDFGAGLPADQGMAPKAICAGPDGALYGIVKQQGAAGAGVFRFTPATNSLTWLHVFSAVADYATILLGSDGLIYGAVDNSGAKTEQVFRLDTNGGNFVVLRTLTSTTSSGIGSAALTEGPDTVLYGVTTRNDAGSLPLLFRLTRDGSSYLSLHDVTAGTNPSFSPPPGLLAAANGQLYGYSSNALFRCNPDGTNFLTVHTFSNTTFSQRLLEGFDGKIYGALPFGGQAARGSVFRMLPDGSNYEEVVSFPGESFSGQAPWGTIITAVDGAFVGLNQVGGDANHGTIFRVATSAQIVGITANSVGFDPQHRFTGSVFGPPGRPIDVLRSDNLQTWTFMQRISAPELNAIFTDTSNPLPPARFYRAVAP